MNSTGQGEGEGEGGGSAQDGKCVVRLSVLMAKLQIAQVRVYVSILFLLGSPLQFSVALASLSMQLFQHLMCHVYYDGQMYKLVLWKTCGHESSSTLACWSACLCCGLIPESS